MTENFNQPKEYDVVLGGEATAPADGVVLGGLDRIKQVLAIREVKLRIDALLDALQYGQEGLDLVIQALEDKSEEVQEAAYLLLQDRKEPRVKPALQAYNPYLFFECFCTIQTHDGVSSLAITSDRQTLVTDSYTYGGEGHSIHITKVWSLQTQQEPYTFQAGSSYPHLQDVAITPDNQILGITSSGDSVELWNIKSWQKIYTSSDQWESFRYVKFSADGQTFVTRFHKGDLNEFMLWDVRTAEDYISYIELSKYHRYAGTLCSDSQTLVTKQDDHSTIDSWSWQTGNLICTFKGHTGDVRCAVISSDLRLLLGGTDEHTIIVWNLRTGQKLSTLKGHLSSVNCIALSADGQTLVSSSDDGMIKMWGLP